MADTANIIELRANGIVRLEGRRRTESPCRIGIRGSQTSDKRVTNMSECPLVADRPGGGGPGQH